MEIIAFESIPIAVLMAGLYTASIIDFRTHKIPNFLVLLLLLAGIGFQVAMSGLDGILNAFSGIMVGLLILFPLFYFGGIGAGDVKLMAAAGAFMNAPLTFISILLSVYFATFIGIFLLFIRGGLRTYVSRYILMAKTSFHTGKLLYIPPKEGEVARQKFPCAIAIALGCTSALYFADILKLA